MGNNKSRIKRICLINPQGYVEYPAPLGKTDTGGQITYIFELSKALGKKGIKVDIITRQFDNRPQSEEICENVSIIRIPCGPDKFVVKEKLYQYAPEMADNLLDYLNKNKLKYSLINSHYWDGGYVGLHLAKVLEIPHIHTPHSLGKWKKIEMSPENVAPHELNKMYRYQVRIAAEQKILNQADAIILQAESLRIKMLQNYIVDFEKLFVIFPGVDTSLYNTKKTKQDDEVKLSHNSILTISRMVPNKGIDKLIDALNIIKNKVDFHLYIGGGGKNKFKSEEEEIYKEKVESEIKKYHLQKRVSILGHIENGLLASYYRKADILAYPSTYEPFGIVPMEAMACGTTTLVSKVAGCKEVIVDGLNGFVIDPLDTKEMGKTFVKVLSDNKLRKKVATNAAMTINDNYSWDKISESFIDLFGKFV